MNDYFAEINHRDIRVKEAKLFEYFLLHSKKKNLVGLLAPLSTYDLGNVILWVKDIREMWTRKSKPESDYQERQLRAMIINLDEILSTIKMEIEYLLHELEEKGGES